MENGQILRNKSEARGLNQTLTEHLTAASDVTLPGGRFSLVNLNLGHGQLRRNMGAFFHSHPDYQIQFVTEGRVHFKSRRSHVTLTPPTLLIIPPNLEHSWKSEEGALLIGLAFTPEKTHAAEIEQDLHSKFGHDICSCDRPERFDILWQLLLDTWARRRPRKDEQIPTLLRAWFCEILYTSLPQAYTQRFFRPDTDFTSPGEKTVEQAKQIMQDNLEAPISIDAVAESVGKSPRQLHRLFKSETGLTPHQYFDRLRLSLARDLVRREFELPLKQIAAHCGFQQLSHFTAKFRQVYGCPPSTLRQRHR